jgi:small GTP-binding protein
VSGPGSDLREYTKAKQSLADLLQQLLSAMRTDGDDQDDSERCRNLLAKIAEDRFTIAVVGQFNRGKSTLLNALLGKAILPTGVLPVTSVVTSITYGAAERLTIKRKAGRVPAVVPLERIADYVTEAGNPGNREQIQEAIVETPLPLARRGVSFVDTPGIASAQAANNVTTYEFLPNVDAVVFVTSVESPMSAPETELLREALGFARELFIVVNKFDLVEGLDSGERERLLAWVQEQTMRITGTEPRVYPMSSRRALETGSLADNDQTDRSGLRDLVNDIQRFLAEKGQQAFLSSVFSKAIRLASEIDSRARLSGRIAEMRMEGTMRALEALSRSLDAAEQEVEAALTDLRSHLLSRVSFLEKHMIAMTPVWHSILAETAGDLDREPASSQLFHESWQDRLLAELAEEQTAWLAETLRKMRRDLAGEARQPLERIAEAVASFDREAAGIAFPSTPIDEAVNEQLDLPDFTVLGVSAAVPKLRSLPVGEFFPPALRRRLIGRSIRRSFDSIIEASHESVLASCKGSLSILADTIARDARRQLRRRRRALSEPLPKGPSSTDPLATSILKRMEELRRSVLSDGTTGQDEDVGLPPLLAWATIPTGAGSSTRPDTKTRCSICREEANAQFALFAEWQYLLSRDGRFRDAFVREGGFCPLHTWQFEQIASPQTISHGFAPLLESIAVKLEQLAEVRSPEAAVPLDALIHGDRTCTVCAFLRREEESAIRRFLADLAVQPRRKSFEASFGICLPHFITALQRTTDHDTRKLLLRHQVLKLEETVDNMRSYAVKRGSLRRELIGAGEENAWNDALRRIVGERNIRMSASLERLL